MTSFTKTIRLKYEPLWEASRQHRFIQQLIAGTLPEKVFRYYLFRIVII